MEINDKINFAADFISHYSTRGFGSMNKNDFEVLVFDLLRRYGNLKSKTNYQSSILLQFPETKVRRLAYEADLKYGNFPQNYIEMEFFKIIESSKFRGDQNRIMFVIENKFLRTSISAKLKELGHFSDSSFNSEIISIHIDSFIDLLEIYYPKKDIDKIVNECKTSINKEKEEGISFKLIMRKFIEGVAAQAGKKTVDLGVTYFTGGIENINELIKSIKHILSSQIQ